MWDGVAATYGPPRAVLSANADEIWLKGRRGDFHLSRTAVVRVGRGPFYPWFFQGVRIRHNIAGYPLDLQFRAVDGGTRDILAQLKSLGFPAG
jgi:hypothetical protein